MRLKKIIGTLIVFTFLIGVSSANEPSYRIGLDVKEFKLANGMLFLVIERPSMPQIACRLAIRAGSALETTGKTGIAHMLEHMMFKGTQNFGTIDLKKDLALQREIEDAYQIVLAESINRNPNRELIKEKIAFMNKKRLEVQKIYVPQAFSTQLGKNGAVGVNAFTSMDQTQFMMSIPSDMLEQWFSIASEQLFEPSWREFYVEKEVVQREWAFRYVNNPNGAAWLDLFSTAFVAHPYHNPVIGWKSDMEQYSTKDAVEFHTKYYNPANAVCVLVGDLKIEDAKRLAETYFERYPVGKRASEHLPAEPPQQGVKRSIRYLKGSRTPLVKIGFHGARMGEADFYALDAMTMILSHGLSSRMRQNIVDRGLASQAWAYNSDNRYAGMVVLGGTPNDPEKLKGKGIESTKQAYLNACKKMEKLLLQEVAKLKQKLVSKSELERIKKLNQRDFLDQLRSNESLAGRLATLEIQTGWHYLLTYLDEIAKITPQQIIDVIEKYLNENSMSVIYVIPGGRPDNPPEQYSEIRSAKAEKTSKTKGLNKTINYSKYPTPEKWRHPLSFERHPHKIVYPKAEQSKIGDTPVFYLPDHELPLIDLSILVKAGSVDVDNSKIGLAHLINNIIVRGGTKKYSPSQMALVLDENAIKLSFSVREEVSIINLSVMADDWNKGLELVQELISSPRFDPEILDIEKKQALMGLKRQGGNARAVCMREAKIWHFKGHPYGRDPLLGLQTIPAITRDDLKQFIKKYIVPENMVIAVAGDIGKDTALRGLGRLFRALPKGEANTRETKDPDPTPSVLAFIHKPGQVQSQVGIRLPSLKRTDPDYWKTSLLMSIFGGSDSLLYTRLRDDLGLVYSAWFYQTYKWQAGMLVGYIGCKGDKTAQSISETVKIMKSLQKSVSKDELRLKRLDALNSFVFNVDTPLALVEAYAGYQMRHEPLETLDAIQNAYLTATREELEKLAQELLDPQKLQIFVVGDKTFEVSGDRGKVTLERSLKTLAKDLGLEYKEIELR